MSGLGRRFAHSLLCWTSLVALLEAGCRRAPGAAASADAADEVVATFRGGEIRRSDVEAWTSYVPHMTDERTETRWGVDLVEIVATQMALAAAAERDGLAESPEVAAQLTNRDEVTLAQALQSEVRREVVVPEAEVEALLARFDAARDKPERRRMSWILKQVAGEAPAAVRAAARDELDALRRRAVAGEDFAALAREASDSPTRFRGGSLGAMTRGQLPPALEAAVFALREGEVSEVLEAREGLAIFRCDGVVPARVMPVEEARTRIEQRLRADLAEARWAELARELAAGEIELDADARRHLLAAEARRRGLDGQVEVAGRLRAGRWQVLSRAELARRIEAVWTPVGEAEVRELLAAEPSQFQTLARWRLAALWQPIEPESQSERYHLLADAVERLRSGELDFPAAAALASRHPRALPSGELGWRSRREVASWGPTALRAIESLRVGEVSEVIQETSALWVFQVLEADGPRPLDPPAAAAAARDLLERRKRAGLQQDLLRETLAKLELRRVGSSVAIAELSPAAAQAREKRKKKGRTLERSPLGGTRLRPWSYLLTSKLINSTGTTHTEPDTRTIALRLAIGITPPPKLAAWKPWPRVDWLWAPTLSAELVKAGDTRTPPRKPGATPAMPIGTVLKVKGTMPEPRLVNRALVPAALKMPQNGNVASAPPM